MKQRVLSLDDDLWPMDQPRPKAPTTTCATCEKIIKQADAFRDATGETFCDEDCFVAYPYDN